MNLKGLNALEVQLHPQLSQISLRVSMALAEEGSQLDAVKRGY